MANSKFTGRAAPSLHARDLEKRQVRLAQWERSTIGSHDNRDANMLFALDTNERMIRPGRPLDLTSEYRPMRRPDNDLPYADLLRFVDGRRYKTILADPPWRFINRTGKVAPEHRRLSRSQTSLPQSGSCRRSAQIGKFCRAF
jgi:hypothetical protein